MEDRGQKTLSIVAKQHDEKLEKLISDFEKTLIELSRVGSRSARVEDACRNSVGGTQAPYRWVRLDRCRPAAT